MRLIGLTGGIGMGKSTVADFLASRGELVVDTDQLARRVVEPGEPALEEVRTAFGGAVFLGDGRLDRKALGALVFRDPASRTRLEGILHPRIRQLWQSAAAEWRRGGVKRGFVVIPLLYETGAETEFDLVYCVACGAAAQRGRLAARGWSDAERENRIAAQMPIGAKMDRADGVIWNDSTLEICREQCARLLRHPRASDLSRISDL